MLTSVVAVQHCGLRTLLFVTAKQFDVEAWLKSREKAMRLLGIIGIEVCHHGAE